MDLSNQDWFLQIRRPSRYLGNEINMVKKDYTQVEVSIALAFPDVYEVGMSHLGLKILYHLLNKKSWIAAERVFAPWVDLEEQLRYRKIHLATLESNRPLSKFDMIGFSLQHELSYTNVVNMLDLAGIPVLARERDHNHPLIIAGGPACFNPEPMASIFDFIVIGDGEETTIKICEEIRKAKRKGEFGKEGILHEIMDIRGIYIPSFFNVHYQPNGTIKQIESLKGPGYQTIGKAIIADIDVYDSPVSQLVPYTELIHDRLIQEIARGCTRGCRFCQAGMIYRPVRERNPEIIMKILDQALQRTGFEEISLLSLSTGDYSCIGPLLKALMDRHSKTKTAVSLPSLRIDSMDPAWFNQLKKVRKTGFTLAPEVGSDQLRKAINKPLTNQEILQTARNVYDAGWNLIKLYFMIGLPGENKEDLEAIVELARDISRLPGGRGKKPKLNISLATFVPKSHTPFSWCAQLPLDESTEKIQFVRQALEGRGIRVKWNQPEMSWLEGIFARGDRRLTNAVIEAWRMGARFDAWGEHFNLEVWEKAFQRTGIEPAFYLHRTRDLDEIFPWEHIQTGVSKEYLKEEWKKTEEGVITTDCRNQCHHCGVCDFKKIQPIITGPWSPGDKDTAGSYSPIDSQNDARTYHIVFTKLGKAKYLSHLELMRVFRRAFRRIGLPLAFSKGYHPLPKISFYSALPVGMESLCETIVVELMKSVFLPGTIGEINKQLPMGIRVTHMEESHRIKKGDIKESHYALTLSSPIVDPELLDRFNKSTHFSITKTGAKKPKETDLKPIVRSLDHHSPDEVRMIIKHVNGSPPNPSTILGEILNLDENRVKEIKVLKTRQIIG